MKLKHYDDKKEKFQSHEVSCDSENPKVEINIVGYGATKKDAMEDFKEKFSDVYDCVCCIDKLLEYDTLEVEEVDCLGEKID